jgi:hypothetical protein
VIGRAFGCLRVRDSGVVRFMAFSQMSSLSTKACNNSNPGAGSRPEAVDFCQTYPLRPILAARFRGLRNLYK